MREQTESLYVEDDSSMAPPPESVDGGEPESRATPGDSLARGTGMPPEDQTKIATPAARRAPRPSRPRSPSSRPPPTAAAPTRPLIEHPDDRLGAVLGSYRIVDVLGRGGMGFVYRADHVKLGREVALKLLRTDYAKRRDAVARFFQEARTVNRIRHRNIVDVTDFVELDDGTTFIIMELLRGESLGKWARQGFDLPRALAVLIQICDGLDAAHAVGVIHRDLKPDNIIIVPTPDGAELVKLLDFGVAKLVNRDDEDVGLETAAGSVIGTPAYMSPEQAGGMPVDARSDIYSVGAIMYELFCGQPMFRGRSFGEYVRKHLAELPPRPKATQGGAGMDDRLELAIWRAIEKDPDRRFGSIAELRDTLLHLLGAIETRPPGRELYAAPAPAASGRDFPDVMTPLPGATGARSILVGSTLTPLPLPSVQDPASVPSLHQSSDVRPGWPPGQSSITGAPARSMPWWVWFAGGALAVGLGIGIAVWFASHGDAPVRAAPTLPPAPELPAPIPAPAPRLVQITMGSRPPAGVYAVGSTTELCTTPCKLDVDLDDGGATTHRDYVFKRADHVDVPVHVVISGDRIEVPVVTLRAIPAAAPTAAPPPRRDPAGRKTAGRTTPGKGKAAAPPAQPAVDNKPVDKPVDNKPVDKKPVDKKKIDRTDTIDPFGGS